jgi:hypothetical protein
MMHLIEIIFILVLILPTSSIAEIIFYEDYDNIPSGWNCSQPIPPRWTGQATCTYDAYGVGHYCGEVSSGGRKGNSLKLWRRNGGTRDYCGYLNKALTQSEFSKHYRELYTRFYMKFPVGWDANLGSGETHKLNRFYIRSTYEDKTTSEFLWDVKGPTFKTGSFAFHNPVVTVYYGDTLSNLGVLDGNWHCYELRVKMNSSGKKDGIIQFWIDGIMRYNNTNANLGYAYNDYFYHLLSPAIGNVGAEEAWLFPTGDWYAVEFDDFVVSTTYVGPGDAMIPPMPPKGITRTE